MCFGMADYSSAFVSTHTFNLSSSHHRNVRRRASCARTITWFTAAPRNARTTVTACTEQPRNDANVDDPDSSQGSGPSKSLIGRFLVEVLSLLVGAALICMVVIWRASQSVAKASLRVLLWLSNVRQLGKWAMRRLAGVDSTAVPVTSFREAIGRAYGVTLKSLVTMGRKPEYGTVVETPARQANESDIGTDDFIDSNVRSAVADKNSAVEIANGRRLILVRHAKTTWNRDNDTPDHDRVFESPGQRGSSTSWIRALTFVLDARCHFVFGCRSNGTKHLVFLIYRRTTQMQQYAQNHYITLSLGTRWR